MTLALRNLKVRLVSLNTADSVEDEVTDKVAECRDVHALKQESYYCNWCGSEVPSIWEATRDEREPDLGAKCSSEHRPYPEDYICLLCGVTVVGYGTDDKEDFDPAAKAWGEIDFGEAVLEVDPPGPAQMIGGPLDGRYLDLRREVDEFIIVLAKSGIFTYVAVKDHDGSPLGVYYWDGMTAW